MAHRCVSHSSRRVMDGAVRNRIDNVLRRNSGRQVALQYQRLQQYHVHRNARCFPTQPSARPTSRLLSSSVFASPFSSSDRTKTSWRSDRQLQQYLATATLAEKEEWLNSMIQTSNLTSSLQDGFYVSSSSPSIDASAFEIVLEAMAAPDASKIDPGVPRRAESWMNRLLDLSRKDDINNVDLQPTEKCYQYVIQAWANSDKEQPLVIVNRSERWLKQFLTEECSEEDADLLLPIVLSSEEYQQYQEDILSKSSSTIQSSLRAPLKPSINFFNAFLDGLTRGRPGNNKKSQRIVLQNARKADAILRRLISYYHHYQDQASLVFDTETCNHVIRGWTRCKHDETIHTRVLSIIRLMESYQRESPLHSHVKPNTKSYSMALDALVSVAKHKARNFYNNNARNAQQQQRWRQQPYDIHDDDDEDAQTIPERNQDNSSRNGMDEIEQAHEILQYMHDLHDAGVEGVVPHRVPYNILITGWAGLATFYDYDEAIDATSSPPFKAEEILRTMQSRRDDGFEDATPDVISYEKVITAWANSSHPNAGKRASWWLKQLWNEHSRQQEESTNKGVNLQPTVATYNAVVKALAKTEGALAAENMLLDLGEKYQKDRTPELCPNSESFAIVIRAWMRSADETKIIEERVAALKRAVEWLSSLREIENKKNLSTAPELYGGVLRLCRTAAHPDRAFILGIAKDVFDNFRQSRHRVDYMSYAALLQVGLKVYRNPEHSTERREFVKSLFYECCDDGLMSNLFLRSLSDDVSLECKEMVEELQHQWPLPQSWSRNVKNHLAFAVASDLSPAERNRQETQKRRHSRKHMDDRGRSFV